jgi:putative DNA primase/helicase
VIRDRSEELHAFHARHFSERVNERPIRSNGHRSELTDDEIIRLARGATNSAKVEALWLGDVSGYPSDSEADQALISLLAFYTQDEEQLDRLYRQSKLCRQKWLDRPDYRHRTITHALRECGWRRPPAGLTQTHKGQKQCLPKDLSTRPGVSPYR